MMENNIYQIIIDSHKIDYFYDGKEMCVFGMERLEAAGFKLTGKNTKKMRFHSGVDK